LHNHCSDNDEPISKDNCAFALHCPLLRGPTDFFFCVSKGNTATIKYVNWNEVSCESGILHNHFSDNDEPISKDNSAFALHCLLLRGSTVFFFCVSKGNTPIIKYLTWNEVSCESGILHNHFSDNEEPISKDNCAFALHCSLLRGSTENFFFKPNLEKRKCSLILWERTFQVLNCKLYNVNKHVKRETTFTHFKY
jgi:hypothetical protein